MKLELKNDIFFTEVERLLTEGQTVTLRIRGNSMRPLLRDDRDSVNIRRHRPDEIKKGAVMFFRHNGAYVMHRIKSIAGDDVTFAGDGNYRITECVRRSDIVAVVTHVVRPDGHTIGCTGVRWRTLSAAWLSLPAFVRRCILGFLRRITK